MSNMNRTLRAYYVAKSGTATVNASSLNRPLFKSDRYIRWSASQDYLSEPENCSETIFAASPTNAYEGSNGSAASSSTDSESDTTSSANSLTKVTHNSSSPNLHVSARSIMGDT